MRQARLGVASVLLGALGATLTACAGDPAGGSTPTPVPSATSAGQAIAAHWGAFSAAWITPLAPLAADVLAATAVLVVLARLCVFALPWQRIRARSQLNEWGKQRGPARAIGLTLLMAAGCGLVVFGSRSWALVVIGCAVAVLGTAGLVRWLGVRPLVASTVTDAKGLADPAQSAQLASLVRGLGFSKPQGIETPGASDITQLVDATSKVADNVFVTAMVALVQFVFNVSPWRVEVNLFDARTAGVRVQWNAHTIAVARIDGDALGLPPAEKVPDALLRMAAARVATAMATRYRDMRGLYGTVQWESVGLHDVARAVRGDGSTESRLLASALAHDPGNLLAASRWLNNAYRSASDAGSLEAYIADLERLADTLGLLCGRFAPFSRARPGDLPYPTPLALLARTLVLWVGALRNRLALPGPAYSRSDRDVFALEELVAIIRLMDANPSYDDSPLIEALKERTTVSLRRLDAAKIYGRGLERLVNDTDQWYAAAIISQRPLTRYSLACHLAMLKQPIEPIEESLRIAMRSPLVAAWAPRDPELAAVRERIWPILHPSPPASVWAIAPLADHRERLAAIGIGSTAEFLEADRRRVRSYLGLAEVEFQQLRRIVRLAAHLENNTPEPWDSRVPLVLEALLAHSVDRVEKLTSVDGAKLAEWLDDAVCGAEADGRIVPVDEALATLQLAWAHSL